MTTFQPEGFRNDRKLVRRHRLYNDDRRYNHPRDDYYPSTATGRLIQLAAMALATTRIILIALNLSYRWQLF